jgi:hypothetical protein
MLRDPAFLAQAKKLQLPIEPISGERLQRLVGDVYETPGQVIKELEQILGLDNG